MAKYFTEIEGQLFNTPALAQGGSGGTSDYNELTNKPLIYDEDRNAYATNDTRSIAVVDDTEQISVTNVTAQGIYVNMGYQSNMVEASIEPLSIGGTIQLTDPDSEEQISGEYAIGFGVNEEPTLYADIGPFQIVNNYVTQEGHVKCLVEPTENDDVATKAYVDANKQTTTIVDTTNYQDFVPGQNYTYGVPHDEESEVNQLFRSFHAGNQILLQLRISDGFTVSSASVVSCENDTLYYIYNGTISSIKYEFGE